MTTAGNYQTPTVDMIAVHQALIGSLDAAPSLVEPVDDAGRAEIVGSFYENILEFLHVHHEGEDVLVYPLLKERCPENKAALERIEAQHSLLDDPMAEAGAAVTAWRTSPSAEGARSLVGSMATISEALRPHLEEEESTVLPIASSWMTPEEWGLLPGHALQSFRADKPWLAIGLIREHLSEEQRDRMLEGMPPPVQAMWIEQWQPAFNAFIAEVRA
jgi:Hemerythrin HHE cation binding domain